MVRHYDDGVGWIQREFADLRGQIRELRSAKRLPGSTVPPDFIEAPSLAPMAVTERSIAPEAVTAAAVAPAAVATDKITPTYVGGNSLLNGMFEDWEDDAVLPDHWGINSNTVEPGVTIQRGTTDPRSGAYTLSLDLDPTIDPLDTRYAVESELLPCRPGSVFRASGWIRADVDHPAGYHKVTVIYVDEAGDRLLYGTLFPDLYASPALVAGVWTECVGTTSLAAPEGTVGARLVVVGVSVFTTTVDWDDCALARLGSEQEIAPVQLMQWTLPPEKMLMNPVGGAYSNILQDPSFRDPNLNLLRASSSVTVGSGCLECPADTLGDPEAHLVNLGDAASELALRTEPGVVYALAWEWQVEDGSAGTPSAAVEVTFYDADEVPLTTSSWTPGAAPVAPAWGVGTTSIIAPADSVSVDIKADFAGDAAAVGDVIRLRNPQVMVVGHEAGHIAPMAVDTAPPADPVNAARWADVTLGGVTYKMPLHL